MSTTRIRGIAKLLRQVRDLDSTNDETFEVEAEDELPFVQLGHWVALSGVSHGAQALYWALAMHLNRSRGDRYVWPTTAILAHMLGYSRGDKIKRFVDELVAIGALIVIPVPDLDGPQMRNVYRLRRNPPPGYTGPTSLTSYYAALSAAYEEETAGEAVCPETGADVTPETGGHVTPETGVVTTRSSNKKNEDAPSARSAPDAGGNTSGSRDRARGGSAASGNSKPRRTSAEQQAIRAVRAELARVLPDLAAGLPPATPRPLQDAILAGLAAGTPHERTPQQLVEFRVLPRWTKHWASRFYAGELRKQPVGPLVKMLGADRSDHDRCDERVDVDTGEECRACAGRAADRRAERRQQRAAERPPVDRPEPESAEGPTGRPVPAPREPAPQWWECAGCAAPGKGTAPANGLCAECAHTPVAAGAPF